MLSDGAPVALVTGGGSGIGAAVRCGGFPLLGTSDVADAVSSMVERGGSGECWSVQPGREPAPFRFRGGPGPAGAGAPPPLHGDG